MRKDKAWQSESECHLLLSSSFIEISHHLCRGIMYTIYAAHWSNVERYKTHLVYEKFLSSLFMDPFALFSCRNDINDNDKSRWTIFDMILNFGYKKLEFCLPFQAEIKNKPFLY